MAQTLILSLGATKGVFTFGSAWRSAPVIWKYLFDNYFPDGNWFNPDQLNALFTFPQLTDAERLTLLTTSDRVLVHSNHRHWAADLLEEFAEDRKLQLAAQTDTLAKVAKGAKPPFATRFVGAQFVGAQFVGDQLISTDSFAEQAEALREEKDDDETWYGWHQNSITEFWGSEITGAGDEAEVRMIDPRDPQCPEFFDLRPDTLWELGKQCAPEGV